MKFLIIASMVTALGAGAAQAEQLRIGTSADFPPWGFTDASGQIVGFDREVADEICKRIDAECSWTNQAFDGLLPSLQVGKFDIVISGLSVTEERAKQIDFTQAYADAPYHFAGPKDSEARAAKTREELEKTLEDKAIGVQTGSTHEQVVKNHLPSANVRLYERNEQIADDLAAGRLDAGLLEQSVWQDLMKGREGQIELIGPMLTSADYSEFGNGQALALKKGRDELKARINKAIADMLSDGTMSKISNKFFGYDLSFKG
ncbi:transporter substrate-binding domain-containing protein (plasmid) [Agrobacterium tumefaciens]|uniref:Transporter substrate-binding domain-containing protein n=2 Tax=Agrobacterium tumefaciens TaxID=358 RepID=A0AAJ4TDD9_AGRTU|nr:transporter substrate-binding domain-containing protein [Agrobacterium tumefaciens]